MRISVFTDYAFRVLMQAAARDPDLITIQDVAVGYGISKNHLMKVIHELSKAGLLETQRGRNGGFRLRRPAEKIRLGDIFRMGESDTPLVECFSNATNTCVVIPGCKLKYILADAEKAFVAVLDRYTLKDVMARPAEFLRLLHVPETI
jgi:Rrf2 family nitric oxide-sensitive transcriptional repressor